MSEGFGFTVKRDNKNAWCVFLPHQCDKWDIAGEADNNHAVGVPHAEAVAELERFIAEAQAALVALRAERELNVEDA